jgi:hypothetical protein
LTAPYIPPAAPTQRATKDAVATAIVKDLQYGDTRRPDFERTEFKTQQELRDLCHALAEGTRAIHGGGEKFNPKWPAEKPAHYQLRATMAQVARYYRRTVQAAVGLIFYTPPSLPEEAPEELIEDAKNIDGRGTGFDVFAKQLTTEAFHGGFVGIFVDMPSVPDGAFDNFDLSDEQALGLRPHWTMVKASQIISWVVEIPDWEKMIAQYLAKELTADDLKSYAKAMILRQVVIHEEGETPLTGYGTQCEHRYRVLRLTDAGVTFEVWVKRTSAVQPMAPGASPVPPSQAGKSIERTIGGEYFERIRQGVLYQAKRVPFREIPIAIAYAGEKQADFVAEPPLLGLAQLNLDHYIITSDRRYLMRLCHAPTLTLIGYEGDIGGERDDAGTGQRNNVSIKVGPNTVIQVPLGGDAKYVSASPNALDASLAEREEIVRQMAMLGLSFLAKDRKMAQETATGRAIDDSAESATNADAARGMKDGFEQAWKFHAMYRGVEPSEVRMQTSFVSTKIDAQIAAILWQAVASDRLDVDSWIEYIQTGELPEDIADRLHLLQAAHDAAREAEIAAAADATKAGDAAPMNGPGGLAQAPKQKMITLQNPAKTTAPGKKPAADPTKGKQS